MADWDKLQGKGITAALLNCIINAVTPVLNMTFIFVIVECLQLYILPKILPVSEKEQEEDNDFSIHTACL